MRDTTSTIWKFTNPMSLQSKCSRYFVTERRFQIARAERAT
jgi:hypothetical protein